MARAKDDSKVPELAKAVAEACKTVAGIVSATAKFRRNVGMMKQFGAMQPAAVKELTEAIDAFNTALIPVDNKSTTRK